MEIIPVFQQAMALTSFPLGYLIPATLWMKTKEETKGKTQPTTASFTLWIRKRKLSKIV